MKFLVEGVFLVYLCMVFLNFPVWCDCTDTQLIHKWGGWLVALSCLSFHLWLCVFVCICVCSLIRTFSWIALNTQCFHLHINSQHADRKVFFSFALFHYRYVIKLVDLIHSGVEMVGPKKREMSGIILNYFYSGILASNDIR